MTQSIINTSTRSDAAAQATGTPWEFIHALGARFGTPVDFDLAASPANAKAPSFFTEEDDALLQVWRVLQQGDKSQTYAKLAYLNPPFSNIRPWARKVAECSHLSRWTVMLVPHSASSRWYLEELVGRVHIDAIPRLRFEGHDTIYPKDLCLVVAGFGMTGTGYWDWQADFGRHCAERVLPLPKGYKPGVRADLYNTPDPFYA